MYLNSAAEYVPSLAQVGSKFKTAVRYRIYALVRPKVFVFFEVMTYPEMDLQQADCTPLRAHNPGFNEVTTGAIVEKMLKIVSATSNPTGW